jgi:anti-sigma B factor antagonist
MTTKIEEKHVGNVTVLSIDGSLRFGESDDLLHEHVVRLLSAGKLNIVVNLAAVPYMDSAGLGGVVRCHAAVKRGGGTLKLARLTARLRDLLSITKLLTVFETYDTEEEAVRSFPS